MNSKPRSPNPNRLLVADRDPEVCELLAQAGVHLGFAVAKAACARELREELARLKPTLIVLDPQGFELADIELFRLLASEHRSAVLMIASAVDSAGLGQLQELGLTQGLNVAVALHKPLGREVIEAALEPQLVRHHVLTEQDLRRALDRAQLRVHYQPKLSATSHSWTVTGVEALLRWEHPDYGLVYPDQFIHIAEEHGLIAGLTDYVLQAAVEQLGEWNRAGHQLNLCINMSPKLVTDVEFPDRLGDFLAAHGIAPEQLTIEITELAAIADPERTLDILSRLRLKGIGLSLDDFGTGYSSLTHLYKLPFSEVKIDRSIGRELPSTSPVRMIVCAIIELGHNLGMKVCCEGVENSSALEFLHQAGCDAAQGFVVAHPMAAAEASAWLAGANDWLDGAMRKAS